jgi:amidohydrolase
VSVDVPPRDTAPAQLYDRLDRSIAARRDRLTLLRHDLHAHPELSNREHRTARVIADHLRAAGLDEVRTGVAGQGVVGVLRGGIPGDRVIALRADMDALPLRETSGEPFASTVVDRDYPGGPHPVAHACGHDCHMAAVAIAAASLAEVRDHLQGTALFVFQPAEEGAPIEERGGAKAMLDDGAFDDPTPTMVFGMHVAALPSGTVAFRPGIQFAASCLVRITVVGVGTHASSPWLGADPMPAAAAIIGGAAQLYRQVTALRPMTVTIGHVEDLGRFNVIGGSVTLWGTARATTDVDMRTIQRLLARMAEHTASAHGCAATVDYLQPVPAVDNAPAWIEATLPTLRRVVGAARVVPAQPTLVYDDVSELVNAFGGVYLQYGVQDVTVVDGVAVEVPGGRGMVPNHHPGFYANDSALPDSVRLHAHVAVDHLAGLIDVVS